MLNCDNLWLAVQATAIVLAENIVSYTVKIQNCTYSFTVYTVQLGSWQLSNLLSKCNVALYQIQENFTVLSCMVGDVVIRRIPF